MISQLVAYNSHDISDELLTLQLLNHNALDTHSPPAVALFTSIRKFNRKISDQIMKRDVPLRFEY